MGRGNLSTNGTNDEWIPPAYLMPARTDGEHIYGTLRWEAPAEPRGGQGGLAQFPHRDNRDSHGPGFWIIDGEPAVTEMAKRLFPGSEGRGQGIAKFPATKRAAGDLNWLMLRYPLRVSEEHRERWQAARLEAIEHSRVRRDTNDRRPHMPTPVGFSGKLLPFQEEGLAYLTNNERCLLADAMGTGKTVEALAWLHANRLFPALVIAQPHVVPQWLNEIQKFLPGAAVYVAKGLTPKRHVEADIILTHYLLLRAWKQRLLDLKPAAVVFDEIQELRHTGTEKYSAASLVAETAPKVVGLSGTPIYNHGAEIWNVLNVLDYHCLGDFDSFTREWCWGYGREVVKDPVLLGDYLRREGLMLRRRIEELLPDLPAKRRVLQHIDVDRGLYDSLIGDAVDMALDAAETKDVFKRGRLTREAINITRRATGVAKAKYVSAFVRALLEADEPVLLFAYHHDVWDLYTQSLREFQPVRLTGHETTAQKAAAVKAFMDGETDLCMVSLRAATGLNLQRATCVVFGELDWSPAIHSQAEDRAHRIGQKGSVLCYYLMCDEGTDQDMTEALGLKVEQFTGLMGDKPETEEDKALAESVASDHMKRVIEKLKARGRRPSDRPRPEPLAPPEEKGSDIVHHYTPPPFGSSPGLSDFGD